MPPSHPLAQLDIARVTELIERVGREIVMPRFGSLGADDVLHKSTPGYLDDLVTVADREAEVCLTAGLRDIVDAHVVGEEATHEHEEIAQRVQSDAPVWIVDPIDGTHNFAAGHDGFGIMVGFAVSGRVDAGWIHLPARGETFVAIAGGGAFCNDVRIVAPDSDDAGALRGSFFTRFMPPDERDRLETRIEGKYAVAAPTGAAALEYTEVLRGRKDFAVYFRLLPWDHGAPALILSEGGGCVVHVNGEPYTVRSPDQLTIAARSPRVADDVRGWLAGAGTSRPAAFQTRSPL
jgi:fructose-1,6-bisphosphatase/inositol monophosphatase family enzyme